MKNLFLLTCVLFISGVAFGQDAFSVGPKIGYNSNRLTTDFDSIKSSINNSFQVGAFVRIGSKFYVQPEANYQVVSSSLNLTKGASIKKQDITIKTLKIPVLLGYKLISQNKFNFRVLAGPALSFNIDKKLSPSDMGELWPIQSVDDLKNSTWSVQMGGGIDVFFLTLDVRYEVGIDNLYTGADDVTMKNNIFNVSLGLKIL